MIMHRSLRSTLSVSALLTLVVVAGCEPADTISGPETAPLSPPVALAVGDAVYGDLTVMPGIAVVCAFYPEGATGGTSTFSFGATSGDVLTGDFDITPVPDCYEVWNATGEEDATVTATLLADPANLELDAIVTMVGPSAVMTTYTGVSSVSEVLNQATGAQIWFKFREVEVPPPGGEGCTPGYWRQEHHYDSWVGYSPSDLFNDVFGVDYYPGVTLGEAVQLRGGGLNALTRHAVAALLNASSGGVNYDYTEAQVISSYQEAAAGSRGDIENMKNRFDFLNNQGCGLN